MKTRCAVVRHRLPGVDSTDELSPRLQAHIATCLTCQAEAARYRSLRRRMGALADEFETAPAELVPAVVAAMNVPVEEEERISVAGRVAIAASATVGAAVAAGAGVVIVIGRRRSHLTT